MNKILLLILIIAFGDGNWVEESWSESPNVGGTTFTAISKTTRIINIDEYMKAEGERAKRRLKELAEESNKGSMVQASSQVIDIIDSGEASTYGWGEKLNTHTFSGERFNPDGVSVAMRDVPMGTVVKILDTRTGNIILAKVNDGGPAKRLNRLIDLSKGAWVKLGYNKPGLTNVQIEVLRLGKGRSYK